MPTVFRDPAGRILRGNECYSGSRRDRPSTSVKGSSHRPIPQPKGSSHLLSQRIVPSQRSDRPIVPSPILTMYRPIVPLSIFLETGSSHHPNLFLNRSSHRPIHMNTNRPISEKRSSHRPIHMNTNRPISERRSSHRPISQKDDRPIVPSTTYIVFQ